jgi:hypothetical protein
MPSVFFQGLRQARGLTPGFIRRGFIRQTVGNAVTAYRLHGFLGFRWQTGYRPVCPRQIKSAYVYRLFHALT